MIIAFANAAQPAENSDDIAALLRDTPERLRLFSKDDDLRGVTETAHEFHLRWVRRELDIAVYARLMLQVVERLDAGSFSDRDQFALAEHYCLMLLESAEELPIEVEIKLLSHGTRQGFDSTDRSLWPGYRRRRAQRLLHGWRRLREAADPNHDFDHPGFSHQVRLPKGYRGPASLGMGPESIADPKLRAEYEKAIAENSRKWAAHNTQVQIRRLSERLFPRAEAELVESYSKSPIATAELNDLLREYLDDDPARVRVIKKVESNIGNDNGR